MNSTSPEKNKEKSPTHDPRYHWDREEHILLLEAYLKYKERMPSKESKEIEEISTLLRQYHIQKGNPIHEQLRNPNGVYMKMMNFRRFDPSTESRGLPKGNKLEGEIWNEYTENQEELERVAALIRSLIQGGRAFPTDEEIDEPEMETEGRVIGCIHKKLERSQKNRSTKIRIFAEKHGRIFCESCGFDFEAVYGERGRNFCEMKTGGRTKLQDLRCVCSNCHRMIHKSRPWLSVEQLKNLIRCQQST
jgi:5-methylcytosine-specific restriction protein A